MKNPDRSAAERRTRALARLSFRKSFRAPGARSALLFGQRVTSQTPLRKSEAVQNADGAFYFMFGYSRLGGNDVWGP